MPLPYPEERISRFRISVSSGDVGILMFWSGDRQWCRMNLPPPPTPATVTHYPPLHRHPASRSPGPPNPTQACLFTNHHSRFRCVTLLVCSPEAKTAAQGSELLTERHIRLTLMASRCCSRGTGQCDETDPSVNSKQEINNHSHQLAVKPGCSTLSRWSRVS